MAILVALVPSPAGTGTRIDKVRGVIISTHTDGSDWGSPELGATMEEIQDLGAGWISTHPYGWIQADGTVRFREIDPADPPEWLHHPIRTAHAMGLKVLIKPHLGYWGSPFSWRGAITFSDDASWERFFTSYETWITQLAAACRDADGFVVATELDLTLAHEAEWRRIIAGVRACTDAPLTYAANWTHYREVGFWDALDVIGIQAYFPLADRPDPDRSDLEAGWRRIMTELRTYATEMNRKIVFTELGYSRAHRAPMEPWAYGSDGPEAEATQALTMRTALEAVEREPAVVGVFLWKWFPNPHPVGRNFQLATPAIRRVITETWKGRS